ncbi:archaetidylserine decarboxylase [Paenibacillus alkaliterrae]|uniref:archaetidylserine decarboxylase n=1 Tax=Paenibacillus alkaliterrae TaxID=320909 RepID=UPI001EE9E7A0|nr:archaetidylserine decarboxylase [Paenibacillus alkaliterrae]MCF2937378.1 archaetidylserine decarboxylase [Paenibacillus alkaliterrae]
MTKWLLRSMTELSSRKWISRITGKFAQSSASQRFISRFAATYGIKIEEAEKPLSEYRTLNEFFTRRLKPGLRSTDEAEDSLVSPVDAVITGAGFINSGTILNVKGQNYTIDELLNRSPRTANYMNGFYLVLYLSPTDYHRIHAPVSGRIVEREHIAGKVYPVNDFGLRHMRRVLSRNERLITYMRNESGETAVVKVGAMNVSSIQYVQPMKDEMKKGEELAYFEFGSTVVLLMEDETFTPRGDIMPGVKVRMGERLGSHRGQR